MRPRRCPRPTPSWCRSAGPASEPLRRDCPMTTAAIYARVSSARQKKNETIASQTAALRSHAAGLGVELPEEWVFEDEGHSGATLLRPALERLRDLVASVGVDVVLCYSPDRLARKFAYQALLIEEFARAGTRVAFICGPRGDSPEDQLLVQFQGMFAEYEKAQLMERYRRGKTYRARAGAINVLGGAPFGYRYIRKTPDHGARYEIVDAEAALVAEMFRRYTDHGATIADLTRWLSDAGVPTRSGKTRWDRSVVWGMLRNPAYAGTAMFGKTQVAHQPAGLNRVARRVGRTTPRATKTVDRPRQDWIAIPVPAIVSAETFARAAPRLEDNKRFASRHSKPARKQRHRLELALALAKASTSITRMIAAYAEQLITIDELRTRMPDLRARQTNLRNQLQALDTQLADRDAYLKLADNLENCLTQLQHNAATADVGERQRVLRLLVKNVLIGPERITIQHSIPVREHTTTNTEDTDTESDYQASCPL